MFETTNQLLFFSGCLLYIKWRTPKFLLNLIYSVWDVCRILVTSNQQDMANPRCQRKQVRKCYYNHHPAVHQRTYLSLAVLIEYRHVYIATQYIINMYICISAYIYIYIMGFMWFYQHVGQAANLFSADCRSCQFLAIPLLHSPRLVTTEDGTKEAYLISSGTWKSFNFKSRFWMVLTWLICGKVILIVTVVGSIFPGSADHLWHPGQNKFRIC